MGGLFPRLLGFAHVFPAGFSQSLQILCCGSFLTLPLELQRSLFNKEREMDIVSSYDKENEDTVQLINPAENAAVLVFVITKERFRKRNTLKRAFHSCAA